MTHLATDPADPDQLDLLELVADQHTPLGSRLADVFREACWAEAAAHHGWVNPNRVRARVTAELGEVNPRAYSAQWAPACGRDGFLTKTDQFVPIAASGSKGNGNKQVALRRWKGWTS